MTKKNSDLPSLNEAWLRVSKSILDRGSPEICRGMPTKEVIGNQSLIYMPNCVLSFVSRKLSYEFMCAEAWWILTGCDKISVDPQIERNWKRYSDDGETTFGAYGPKLISQMDYIIETLKSDIGSRQAIISYWRENPPVSKDIPCTIYTQFLIRRGVLHINHHMRSSDIWLGYPYDVFNFAMVAAYVAIALRQTYPFLHLGCMMFTAGSQHVYDDKEQKLRETFFKRKTFPYAPLDIAEFKEPQDLVSHLFDLKEKRWDKLKFRWLNELQAITQ